LSKCRDRLFDKEMAAVAQLNRLTNGSVSYT
jgi:hypothetical protein